MASDALQYVIALKTHQATAVLTRYLVEKLQSHDFDVHTSDNHPGLIVVTANALDLEVHGEHLKIRKPIKATGELQEFDVATRRGFRDIDTSNFWLPFEEAYLTRGLLDYVRTDDGFREVVSEAGGSLKEEEWLERPILEVCNKLKLLSHVGPLHQSEWRAAAWLKSRRQTLLLDLDPIRNYFGERVAFYFAWMNFMTAWLLVPAVFSLAIWAWPTADASAVGARMYIPLYSGFMVLWGVLGAKFWRRTTHYLAWKWDTASRDSVEDERPAFKGQVRISPVTGEPEVYFWSGYRFFLYLVSWTITGLLLSAALTLIISMLNLQGYIHPEDHHLYIPKIGTFSRPGQLFDPTGAYGTAVLVIRAVTVLTFKKLVYIPCAELLTSLENHRTAKAHRNSIILKRYLCDASDRYLPLLYLAFFRTDLAKIQKEFQALYLADVIRRLLTETLVPLVKVRTTSKRAPTTATKVRDSSVQKDAEGDHAAEATLQAVGDLSLPVYDEFDDFLEMGVEFGYITMFAAAYPPAAVVSLVVNLLEVRSDLFKLTHVYRRPEVVRAGSIGSWQGVFESQAWLSVLTNAVMVAFTGQHLVRWLPALFRRDNFAAELAGHEHYSSRLLVVMVAEHVLLLMMLLVTLGIPDVPELVRESERRMAHMQEQTFLRTQQQQRRGLLVAMSLSRKQMEDALEGLGDINAIAPTQNGGKSSGGKTAAATLGGISELAVADVKRIAGGGEAGAAADSVKASMQVEPEEKDGVSSVAAVLSAVGLGDAPLRTGSSDSTSSSSSSSSSSTSISASEDRMGTVEGSSPASVPATNSSPAPALFANSSPRPALVTITSPMPPLGATSSPRRVLLSVSSPTPVPVAISSPTSTLGAIGAILGLPQSGSGWMDNLTGAGSREDSPGRFQTAPLPTSGGELSKSGIESDQSETAGTVGLEGNESLAGSVVRRLRKVVGMEEDSPGVNLAPAGHDLHGEADSLMDGPGGGTEAKKTV